MNRIAILTLASVLALAAAAGQTARSLYSFHAGDDRGWLGVSVQDVTKKLAEREGLKAAAGAYVSDVVAGSPAEDAGILVGDVIVRLGSREIDDADDLVAAVRKSDPGEEVTVVVERGGDTKTLKAVLDEAETPRAFTLTIPRVPGRPLERLAPFAGGFYRSDEALGLRMQDMGRQLAEYFEVPGNRGVLVTSVSKKSSADRAGLRAGDVIVRVNGAAVRDVDDVVEELRDAEEGTVPFDVLRKGKALTLQVEAGNDPGETSFYDERVRDEIREALRSARRGAFEHKGWMRELKEGLRELERELRENARELREDIRDALSSI
jgi:S1-C subfamily serine protease